MPSSSHFDLVSCKVTINGREYSGLLDTGSNTTIFGTNIQSGQVVAKGMVSFATKQVMCPQIRFESNEIQLGAQKIGVEFATEGYKVRLSDAIPNFPEDKFDLLIGTNVLRGLSVHVGPENTPLRIEKNVPGSDSNFKRVSSTSCGGLPGSEFGPLLLAQTNHGHFLVDTGNSFSTFCNQQETSSECPSTLNLMFEDETQIKLSPQNLMADDEIRQISEPISMKNIMECRGGENVRGNIGVEVWCGLHDIGDEERVPKITETIFSFAGWGTKDENKIFCKVE